MCWIVRIDVVRNWGVKYVVGEFVVVFLIEWGILIFNWGIGKFWGGIG